MGPIKTRACGLGLFLVGVLSVAAHADTPPPASLRMRAAPAKPARWSPMRWAKRVAQVAPATADDPAPQSADASGTQPADPQPAAPAAEPAAAPEPAPVPEPAAPAADAAPAAPQAPAAAPAASLTAQQQTPDLSDEELAKLSEQSAKEEIITVTGSTI